MTSMIRVLVFAEFGWRNGGENSWLAVAKQLGQTDCQFIVACPGDTEFSRHVGELGFECLDWQLHDQQGQRKSQAEIRSEIAALVKIAQPDLLHANSLSTARLVGPVCDAIGLPVVGYLRDIIKLSRQAIKDINNCTQLIAVSDATRNFHCSQGLEKSRCLVINNGVDLDHFRPAESDGKIFRELELKNDQRLLLCVGQIGMRKGTDTVIKSFQKIHQQFPGTVLLVVGMRNSQKQEAIEFEQTCRQASQQLPVHWLGRRSDISELMNASTMLLHGARQEPLGRVLLEAMASGLPFVATRVGGTEEVVGDLDPAPLLCPPDCSTAMAELACYQLENESARQEIALKFRLAAKERFSDQKCSSRTLEVYRLLTGK